MTYPNSSDSEMETLLSALTDALLADKNIDLIADPTRSLMIIMKDGQIFKDTLPT